MDATPSFEVSLISKVPFSLKFIRLYLAFDTLTILRYLKRNSDLPLKITAEKQDFFDSNRSVRI